MDTRPVIRHQGSSLGFTHVICWIIINLFQTLFSLLSNKPIDIISHLLLPPSRLVHRTLSASLTWWTRDVPGRLLAQWPISIKMINLIQFLIQILPNVSQINELISLLQARNLKEVKTNLIQEIVLEPGQGQFM